MTTLVRVEERPARIVRVPVPAAPQIVRTGVPGPPGVQGPSGDVAGTLPWAQVTGKPPLALSSDLLAQQTDVFFVQTDGPQTLHLAHTPHGGIALSINGLFQTDLGGLQLSGAVIDLSAAWHLYAGDTLAVQYGYLP